MPSGALIAAWGVIGIVALLIEAILRLTPLALEPLRGPGMTGTQAALYVAWCGFNAYAEGYRGFQRAFVPRVIARALYLGRRPRPLFVLLAPLFCMGLFHAPRRRLLASWGLLIGISLLVMLVRRLPQPWRGIIDAGVVVGLAYGGVALVLAFAAALLGRPVLAAAQVPDEAGEGG
jgi:hypothetical protein